MLTALALVTAGLLALGPLSLLLPRPSHGPLRVLDSLLVPWGTAALCGAGLIVSLAGSVTRLEGTLVLPVGLPGADGGGMCLAFDGLTGFVLPPLFLCGAASAACAPDGREPGAASLPPLVGCMALAPLAADGFTLLLGVGGMSLAAWGLVSAGADRDGARDAARARIGAALFGGACLVAAMGLLGARTGGYGRAFAAVRAAPPEGWQAAAVLGLTVSGALSATASILPWSRGGDGSRTGPAPPHARVPPDPAPPPGRVGAPLSAAAATVAAYAVVRIAFDLCGPATPAWWGVPLLALGAACAVFGALRANAESDPAGALAAVTASSLGLAAMGLGVALAARGSDLPQLAALALGGALLLLLAHALSATLLHLCAGAVERAAGSRRMAHLGGLMHPMPATALCALVGAASFALVPPGAGFAGAWVLFQSLLAAPRAGGTAWQIAAAAALAAAGVSAALAASAAVRLVGLVFLGRPRTPGAAAAREAPRRVRLALAVLAGPLVLLGLLPGAALDLAGPALRLSVGTEPGGVGVPLVAPGPDAPGYSAPGLAALLAAAGLAGAWVVRARMARGERRGPVWDGGHGGAPDRSPADADDADPAAWWGAASMARPFALGSGPWPRPGTPPLADAPSPAAPAPRAGPKAPDVTPAREKPHDPAYDRPPPPPRRVGRWLARAAARAHRPTPGQSLAVTLSALALALALVAWAGGR